MQIKNNKKGHKKWLLVASSAAELELVKNLMPLQK